MNPGPRSHLCRLLSAVLVAALFGMVVGGKWAAIFRYGSDIPYWDQWDAEAASLLVPWFEGGDFLKHLFHPHNEHRVILTKLQSLALVLLNGQWDARLQCVINAMLHAALAVGCWLLIRRVLAPRWQAGLFLVTAVLFGVPLAWENVLSGFHSQQYWLLLLSFVAITLLPFARPWGLAWWIGTLAATLALGAMASGCVAAGVVAALVGFRLIVGQTNLRDALPTIVVAGALALLGVLTQVHFAPHDPMKAKTIQDFLLSSLRSLAWPWQGQDWAGLLLWFPWLLVAMRCLRSDPWRDEVPRVRTDDASHSASAELGPPPERNAAIRTTQTLAALGGWVLLQVVATAYVRGANANYPASRYFDTLAFGALINAIALAWLLSDSDAPAAHAGQGIVGRWLSQSPRQLSLAGVGVAWTVTLAIGVNELAQHHLLPDLRNRGESLRKAEVSMRDYLATNDRAHLVSSPDIPYPDANALIERLSHPSIRTLMPASIREPLPLRVADQFAPASGQNRTAAFFNPAQPGRGVSAATPPFATHPTWGSFGPQGAAGADTWISAPISRSLGGWLKIETAGQPGEPRTWIEIHDAQTGVLTATVRPSRVPGDSWHAAYVRAPARPFVLVARDSDPTRWLAFSAPVEMASLSYLTLSVSQHGLWIAGISAGLAGAIGVAFLILRWASRGVGGGDSTKRMFTRPAWQHAP